MQPSWCYAETEALLPCLAGFSLGLLRWGWAVQQKGRENPAPLCWSRTGSATALAPEVPERHRVRVLVGGCRVRRGIQALGPLDLGPLLSIARRGRSGADTLSAGSAHAQCQHGRRGKKYGSHRKLSTSRAGCPAFDG